MPNYPQTAPNPKKLNLNDVPHVPMQHPSHHVVSMSACQTLEKRGTEFACWIDVSSIVSPWCLGGNGGMDYRDYYLGSIGTTTGIHSPIPS